MRKYFKAFAGPGVTYLIGAGLQMVELKTPGLGWFFIGIATFWALVAFFKNKALLRRFPNLIEWVPFLEEDLTTPSRELTGAYIRGHSFQIGTITYENKGENRTFEDCDILGPGVLYLRHCTVHDCHLGLHRESFIEVDGEGPYVGIIAIDKCVFRRCRFKGIGFIASRAEIAHLRKHCTAIQPEEP